MKKIKELEEKISKICDYLKRSKIISIVRASMIYNLCKAVLLVFLLLLLIFSVQPKEAFIRAELKTHNDSKYHFQANEVLVKNPSSSPISIETSSPMDSIMLNLQDISINNNSYYDGDQLIISSESSHLPPSITISGEIETASLYDAVSNQYSQRYIYSQASSIRFVGEASLQIYYGKAMIVKQNGETEELDNSKPIKLINTTIKKVIDEHKIDVPLDNNSMIHLAPSEEEYLINSNIVERFSNEEESLIKIELIDLSSSDESHLCNTLLGTGSLISNSAKECRVKASGSLSFSYTPSPEEYSLKEQEIYLSTSSNMLSFSYDDSSSEPAILISGYVDKASLSHMNLFPDFWIWYFSNIYMVPLTLISTIIAAMSMFFSSKKNKDDRDKQNEKE